MKKLRQTKLLAIIALVLAITGMTLGFAAFSVSLNISSSATVTPNSEDFKITIYGVKDAESAAKIWETGYVLDINDFSSTIVYPLIDGNATSSIASIDNINHIISNINIDFNGGTTYQDAEYVFFIKNEGKYDVYLDMSNLEYNSGYYNYINDHTCVAGDNTTLSLVDIACNEIESHLVISKVDNAFESGEQIKISPSEIIIADYIISNGFSSETSNLADGPFSVTFEDIQLEFTTAPPNQE